MVQDTKFIKTSTDNLFIKISDKKRRGTPPYKTSIYLLTII